MLTDAGKHALLNQVLGSSIARSFGYCGTQGKMLRDGREEPGARGRDRGTAYPGF